MTLLLNFLAAVVCTKKKLTQTQRRNTQKYLGFYVIFRSFSGFIMYSVCVCVCVSCVSVCLPPKHQFHSMSSLALQFFLKENQLLFFLFVGLFFFLN